MAKNQWTTQVSVRLENEVNDALEKFASTQTYYTKSNLINLALRQLFINCTADQIYQFLWTNRYVQPCDTKN